MHIETNNNEDTTKEQLNISLSVEEINVILLSLHELPYRVSEPIIRNILEQANTQLTTT